MNLHVDLDEVNRVIERIAAADRDLDQLAADLDAATSRLHEGWAGASAEAHARAQASFGRGLAGMRAALREMRVAASHAHDSYSSAAEANVALWDEIG